MAEFVKDRNYQFYLECIITDGYYCKDYDDLYDAISKWFSSDEMVRFLEDYMIMHDLKVIEPDEFDIKLFDLTEI